ncbi:MAG: HPr(Ser) kinase/phosphatase [Ruminococcaceae bacterium]|jgi:HPr kinase/phosphorylase|nr:HPr(Ser) kinase/phosphatase [Oscillospiraceae bacterium]
MFDGKDFSVSMETIVSELKLKKLYYTEEMDEIKVVCSNVNRPGLVLAGFFEYFDKDRIQIFGKVEQTYINDMDAKKKKDVIDKLFSSGIPAVIIARGMTPDGDMLAAAEKYGVPLLSTNDNTSRFMSELIRRLGVWLAPRITRHGVLVEVYGEGMLILGDSGVGKSEAAIELLKRGHRLVADDAVEIKKVSSETLVGSSPDIIKHYIELRGIGIVNVKNIFGMGAVKDTQGIDLVVKLEPWKNGFEYDRLGVENEYADILGVKKPQLTIPVRQGRNLAVILEVAAMNNRQKRMGYNAADELYQRLNESMGIE